MDALALDNCIRLTVLLIAVEGENTHFFVMESEINIKEGLELES